MFRTFDPFRDFEPFNRLETLPSPAVPLDVLRYKDHVELIFDLPGIDPDSIELTVEKRQLTLTAERRVDIPDDASVISRQRPHGRFTRQMHLGEQLDTDRLEAGYDHGVLTVSVPLSEAAKPRRVAIGANGPAAIEADVTDES